MPPRAARVLYHRAGPALIRATTYPHDLRLPDAPDLSGTPEDTVEQGSCWLRRAWRDERLRKAVEHASPVLSEQIGRVVAGHTDDARRVRRLVRSLGSYVLRWRGRATPFGLFAGATEVETGPRTRARWGDGHRTIARAGTDWLEGAVDRLEQQPRFLVSPAEQPCGLDVFGDLPHPGGSAAVHRSQQRPRRPQGRVIAS